MTPEHSPLGKSSAYVDLYTPDLLFPIPRKAKRDEIGVPDALPFHGYDIWNAYEISWLNQKGKPIVATAEIVIPANSACIIESKSFKLYLNSFNNTHFDSEERVRNHLIEDLSRAAGATVSVTFISLSVENAAFSALNGTYLDNIDVTVHEYTTNPALLSTEHIVISETVHSHLLKSNCLVTGQPDWGSVEIDYTGQKINHEGLLRYLISFRNHNEFHEQCVERIFMDIMRQCNPTELTVYARYTRRGGLDINPFRSTQPYQVTRNPRLLRQ